MTGMKNNTKRQAAVRNDSGIALAFFSIFIPVLIGFIGLVVDLSQVYAYSSRIKSATDLACLAGVSQMESVADVTTAKTTALSYLNNNLSMTLPNFTNLTLSSTGLSIQGGVYNFSNSSWTFDESSSSVNSIRITYTYTINSLLAGYFMINSFNTSSNSIAAKYYAGTALDDTACPITVDQSVLTNLVASGSNDITLYVDAGTDTNAYFSTFDNMSNYGQVVSYLNHLRMDGGMSSTDVLPQVAIGSTFDYISMSLNKNHVFTDELLGWTLTANDKYIFPVVSDDAMGTLTVKGFLGAQVTAFGLGAMGYYIDITVIPGYLDNVQGGLKLGEPTITDSSEKALLADSYGIFL